MVNPLAHLSPPQRPKDPPADPWNSRFVLNRIRPTIQNSVTDGGRRRLFFALGTPCRLIANGPLPAVTAFFDAALIWVAHFEAKYSRYLTTSWISQLNAGAGVSTLESDPETDRLLALCQEMHFLTRGIFDPTALPLIQVWDWKSGRIPSESEINEAQKRVGWRRVERKVGSVRLTETGMALDLGGMGKEYAVDQVSQLSARFGLAGVLVDFGADIRVTGLPADGRPGWHIGLENPQEPNSAWCGLAVHNAAVATSGDYLRHFRSEGRRYGHIIDVRTGRPVDTGCHCVHVLASTCTIAGMLSTAAFVLGPIQGLKLIESQPGAACSFHLDKQRISSRRFHEHVAT